MEMDRNDIVKYLHLLNEELRRREDIADIAIYDETVICLVFNARGATKDIDFIFQPSTDLKGLITRIAREYKLSGDWFNGGVREFLSANSEAVPYIELTNMRIYTATPEYMFAMKALSARTERDSEIEDLMYLIKLLEIRDIDRAYEIIYRYYPKNRILPKTQYLLMELIERMWN